MAKLTENVDEQPISDFLAAVAIFKIPYFQRAYKWGSKEFKAFTSDLTSIVDEEEDVHFLGALITHESYSPTGQPSVYEIVDGQQRLATCTISLVAIAKVMASHGLVNEACDILSSYIYLTKPNISHPSTVKFYPSKGDRKQFKRIVEDVISEPKVSTALNNPTIRYLPVSGSDEGKLYSQYKRAKAFFQNIAVGNVNLLKDYRDALLKNLTVVQIALRDPTNSSKIFERLNYRGVSVTTGDLVRNEIFSRLAAEEAYVIDEIHDNYWEPFFKKFPDERSFENFFFPIGLVDDPNVKKSEVFSRFQKRWRIENCHPQEIIAELGVYQDYYLAVSAGKKCSSLSDAINSELKNLYSMGAASTIYPFILKLCKEVEDNHIDEENAVGMLRKVESFLLRRAVAGIEPSGLHAVFKGLWKSLSEVNAFTGDGVAIQIESNKTVTVINNQIFEKEFETRELYGAKILPFILLEIENSLPGDHPADKPEVEHILPKKYKQYWLTAITAGDHARLLNVIANLIVISPPQNKSVVNREFQHKKERYQADSMYATPRHIASTYDKWDAEEIEKRAKQLSAWALSRWEAL